MSRRWLQIHLLTAVVGMLTASVLVFANLRYFGAEWQTLADSLAYTEPTADDIPRAIPAQRRIKVRVAVRGSKIDSPDIVLLDGRPSVPKVPGMMYQWRQTVGDDLKLKSEHIAKDRVGVRVYVPGRYEFELIVSVNGKSSKPAKVEVDVLHEHPPVPATPHEILIAAGVSFLIVLVACVLCEALLRRKKSIVDTGPFNPPAAF